MAEKVARVRRNLGAVAGMIDRTGLQQGARPRFLPGLVELAPGAAHPGGCRCSRCEPEEEPEHLHHHHIQDVDELEHAETELAWEEVPDE